MLYATLPRSKGAREMIKDLSDNHLFNNYPCEADDAKIESLRQQLSAVAALPELERFYATEPKP